MPKEFSGGAICKYAVLSHHKRSQSHGARRIRAMFTAVVFLSQDHWTVKVLTFLRLHRSFSSLRSVIIAPYYILSRMTGLTAPTTRPVLIIGAGIAGLSTARLLSQHNIPVIVFEQSVPERSQGHSITLRDWAYKPLLSDLGMSDVGELERAVAVDRSLGGCGWIDLTLRDNSTGVTLLAPEPPKPGETEQALFRANRTALRSWLSEGVDLRYEHKLRSFKGNIGELNAVFENGAEVEGSLIVGADGLHSTRTSSLLLQASMPSLLTN